MALHPSLKPRRVKVTRSGPPNPNPKPFPGKGRGYLGYLWINVRRGGNGTGTPKTGGQKHGGPSGRKARPAAIRNRAMRNMVRARKGGK